MTLPTQLKDAIDEMVQRRMANTNETEEQAAEHLIQYLEGLAEHVKKN